MLLVGIPAKAHAVWHFALCNAAFSLFFRRIAVFLQGMPRPFGIEIIAAFYTSRVTYGLPCAG